ncbi:MAG: tRNA (adenosine(37)-N6)-threonylcarbamoyltransferase complex transferase subunit TsaD [Helicobacter sp.]|nr:tRNA (adenosine(37)-N6)-threonylcarbamoyltransferase complex transferase subunit TsaD [Helicobacter sp.]
MILSIESSCDDSSIAITKISNYKLIFHQKISQNLEHSKHGGIVPELASRIHAKNLPKVLENALHCIDKKDLKAIAITTEPGLSISLLEGLMMAKALSLELNIPLIKINHLKGHIFSLFIEKEAAFPLSALLVSGGHTQIIHAKNADHMQIIAQTLDDSFGESFDKVARMLNLPYPGGPEIQNIAKGADPLLFTIPLKNHKQIAFSFSGLKNSIRLKILELSSKESLSKHQIATIASGFQKAACTHVLDQVQKYFESDCPSIFGIVGGGGANLFLRQKLLELCAKFGKKPLFADLKYCQDNAAMIGRMAVEKYKNNDFSDILSAQISPKSSKNEFIEVK